MNRNYAAMSNQLQLLCVAVRDEHKTTRQLEILSEIARLGSV